MELDNTQLDKLVFSAETADNPLDYYQALLAKARKAMYLSADGTATIRTELAVIAWESRAEGMALINQLEEKIRRLKGRRAAPYMTWDSLTP